MAEIAPAQPTTAIRDWLDQLYGHTENGWLTLFAQDRTDGQRHVAWRRVDQLNSLADDATQLAERCCVWFGVATRRQRVAGRGRAEDCDLLPGLWLDIDIAGPNHRGSQPLPQTLEQARRLLAAYPLAPTAVVHTGGGLQAWWLFAEPHMVDDTTAALLARWGHTWAEHGRTHGWHVDNVFDVARVMRLPGTVNRKTAPAPVELLDTDWQRRYHPDDLDQFTVEPPPAPEPAAAERIPYIGPERPGDAFNATRRGGDVLAAAGFKLARRDRNGDEHWTGPWKEPRQGHSATVYGDDGHTTIWSDTALSRWPTLEVRRPYDPFGLYTHLVHHGDWSAASDELAGQGYGQRDMRADDFSWVNLDTRQTPVADSPPPPNEPWDDPEHIHAPDPDPFPLDVLPAWMRDQCIAVADRMQVPIDLCAQVALGAWSAACAGRIVVHITPTWRSHVNLYLATVIHSGGGKSPVDKNLVAPLLAFEHKVAAAAAGNIARAQAEHKILEKQRAEAEKAGNVDRLADAILGLDSHTIPHKPRLVADDSTPERLTELVYEQGGRLAIISPEGAVFDMASGMYSGNSKKTNLDIYLKGWSGDRCIVDRKGSGDRTGTQVVIPEAVLTVAVAVQPSALSDLRRHPELAGRGFTARFMYSVPPSMLGGRDHSRVLTVDTIDAESRYHDEFERLADRMLGWKDLPLRLTPEAVDQFIAWRQSHEQHLVDGGALEMLREWLAKLHGSVPRLAALLHVAHGGELRDPVDTNTMAMALRVGDYWLSHALVVADMWALDEALEGARNALRRFVGKRMETFTEREAWVANRSKEYSTMDDFRPVLVQLEQFGWVRRVDDPETAGRPGRKPSPRYVLHPDASVLMTPSSARCARDSLELGSKNSSSSTHPYLSNEPRAQRAKLSVTTEPSTPAAPLEQRAATPPPTDDPPVGWLIADTQPEGDTR